MDPMHKWIGGAVAALLFVVGGATLAGSYRFKGNNAPPPNIEAAAIPVDPAKLGSETTSATSVRGTTVAEPVAAPVADEFTVKRVLPIDGPIKYGEWFWDDEGVPPGPIVMTVDLQARVISVFRGGYEIGAAAVLLGTDDHPTPLGTFPILYKMRHNVSEKYGNAPMPYSMFLTREGVALHGSEVENGYASRGCVGMPDDFAAKVFAVANKGDRVVITDGETLKAGQSIL